MAFNLLVVEDDQDISRLLCKLLHKQGYEAEPAYSGSEARLLLNMKAYDLVLLDLMLPGMSGEQLIKEIRERSFVPVIVISAKTAVKEKVDIIKSGADDYITKPFDKEEVLARVEAQLRRRNNGGFSNAGEQLSYHHLSLDLAARSAAVNGKPLQLTAKEFELLAILVRSPGKVFTREDLYQAVWNERYAVEDNTINVHISNLRNKLSRLEPERAYIDTVWGIGFKMA
ncbi:DNA-binding response regulator [Paenibacillus oryzae]|uniref:DNA-binding response regulator n=1 Tax=Paenibacillus oryzae TaxID=1844972 RepID=A0A1A5YF11_9BACL|nr:response regulator transcription factor [Paenibacillus oryzae]OBR64231.1 DNA-binding response regulator [Paenibacillus oryzae]